MNRVPGRLRSRVRGARAAVWGALRAHLPRDSRGGDRARDGHPPRRGRGHGGVAALRTMLAYELAAMGLSVAAAGTHPTTWSADRFAVARPPHGSRHLAPGAARQVGHQSGVSGPRLEGTACRKIGPRLARVDPPASVCDRLWSGPFSQLMSGKRASSAERDGFEPSVDRKAHIGLQVRHARPVARRPLRVHQVHFGCVPPVTCGHSRFSRFAGFSCPIVTGHERSPRA